MPRHWPTPRLSQRALLGIAFLWGAGLLGGAGGAQARAAARRAQKRVVFLGVAGAPQAEKELTKLLTRSDTLVLHQKDYARVALQIGATGTTPEDVVRVATRLRASAILAGKLERAGRNYALRLVLREGASGRVIARLRYPLPRPHLDPATERRVRDDLMPVLAEAIPPQADTNTVSAAAPAKVIDAGPGPGDDENPLAVPAGEKVPPAHRAAREDAGPATVVASASREERPAWRSLVDLSAGMAFAGRSYSTNNAAEPTYSSGQIPGVRLDVAVYPAASLGKLGAAIGIDGRYERMLGFNSSSGQTGMSAPTFEDSFSIGARGRWIVREAADSPVLIGRIGYGERRFAIQGDTDLGIPETDYQFLAVGAAARIPLGSPRLALEGQLAYHAVLGAGPITSGASYGSASVYGLLVEGGVDVLPLPWLALRAGMSYSRFGLSFTGNGARHADSASDQYVGGYATVGYVY